MDPPHHGMQLHLLNSGKLKDGGAIDGSVWLSGIPFPTFQENSQSTLVLKRWWLRPCFYIDLHRVFALTGLTRQRYWHLMVRRNPIQSNTRGFHRKETQLRPYTNILETYLLRDMVTVYCSGPQMCPLTSETAFSKSLEKIREYVKY